MKKIFVSILIIGAVSLSAGAATFYAEMTNDDFTPVHLYAPVGTTVTWTNFGTHEHDVVSTTGLFNSGPIPTGGTFSYTFNTAGNYDYICTYHDSIAVPMTGMVHVRTMAQLTCLVSLTPVGGPPVIPARGGSFAYGVTVTNQTASPIFTTFWTKMYYPNNTFVQTFTKAVGIPGSGSRSATLNQIVSASAPPGTYRYQGNLGTNPDSVLAWNSFTFTKSATDGLEGTGWECIMTSDWTDVPNQNAPIATEPVAVSSAAKTSKISLTTAPEPFNPSTVINYALPSNGAVKLEVFNIAGAKVATLVNGYRDAGQHQVTFEAGHLPSGMYLYRLSFGGENAVGKMMLVK